MRQQSEKVLDSYFSVCFDLLFVCPFGGCFVQKLNGSNGVSRVCEAFREAAMTEEEKLFQVFRVPRT